jgi:hypothetical protein
MQVVGEHLYVANYAYPQPSELLIYDIREPADPVLVGSFGTGFKSPREVEVSGDYAYLGVGSSSGILMVVDVSDPASPEEVSELELPVHFSDMAYAAGHILVTLPALPGGGLRTIDVTDPLNPRIDGEYVLSSTFANAVAVLPGGIVALATSDGLNVLQASPAP